MANVEVVFWWCDLKVRGTMVCRKRPEIRHESDIRISPTAGKPLLEMRRLHLVLHVSLG